MDKNTIWAIVLSTLVIVGSYFLLPMVFGNKKADAANQPTVEVSSETAAATGQDALTNEQSEILTDSLFSEEDSLLLAEENEEAEQSAVPAVEQKVSIDTGVAKIIFTTKGGDIISYKLSNHNDKETQDLVQLSDGITDFNRTCGLAIGGAENTIINEIFNYEQPDPYTILFKKNLIIKDTSGKAHSYTVGKRYTFKQNEYMFKLEILIHSNDGTGLDFNGKAYTLRTSPQIGPRFNQKQNRYENRQFIAYNGKKAKKVVLSANVEKKYEKEFLWGGIAGKYFMELVIPTDFTILGTPTYSAKTDDTNYANSQAMFERKAAGQDIQDTYFMYFGPREEKSLKIYNTPEKNAWNFGGPTKKLTEALQTSGMFSWLETILKFCLETLHKFISNWGICIIVLTIILKILMFPLFKKQSMGSVKMQEIQPKLQAIQKKYANDQQKLQQETSKLYQEAGYNPVSGCLPMLFQFLVIIAMFNLFNNYFEFRGAMFIPNWIPDLTEGDAVYTFKFNIPLIGNTLRLLPIIYVGSQLLSGYITQKTSPNAGGQNEKTMKFMTYGMPFMFFFIFYNAPSGLLLYWLTSNIWQVGQQIIINKMMAKKRAEAETEKPQVVQKTLPPKAKKNKR